MYLCHKCSGLLTSESKEIADIIGYCGCISSYIRDWQIPIAFHDALYVSLEQAYLMLATMRSRANNTMIGDRDKTPYEIAQDARNLQNAILRVSKLESYIVDHRI